MKWVDRMDVEALAVRVWDLLSKAEAGTVVTVQRNGWVIVSRAGVAARPAWERREKAVAVFLATKTPPSKYAIRRRIERGLRKLEP